MNCGMECIKYLLFFFNFIFALCGLVIVACGILINTDASKMITKEIDFNITYPATVIIIVGAIIFIIAFFGCCGAIRESHCMIVTFGVLLLTLLVIQVVIAAVVFLTLNGDDIKYRIDRGLSATMNDYFSGNKGIQDGVNTIQSAIKCCGYESYRDYLNNPNNTNRTIPYSCCGKPEYSSCTVGEVESAGYKGCKGQLYPFLQDYANRLGGLSLGIAAVELIGIIFSFCLATAIRNYERRGYRV